MPVRTLYISVYHVFSMLCVLVMTIIAQSTPDLYTTPNVVGVGDRGIWRACNEDRTTCSMASDTGCTVLDDRVRTIQAFSLLSIFTSAAGIALFTARAFAHHGSAKQAQQLRSVSIALTDFRVFLFLCVLNVFLLIAWAVAAGTYRHSGVCTGVSTTLREQGFKLGFSFALILLSWIIVCMQMIWMGMIHCCPSEMDRSGWKSDQPMTMYPSGKVSPMRSSFSYPSPRREAGPSNQAPLLRSDA